jgi:hypothetical protein
MIHGGLHRSRDRDVTTKEVIVPVNARRSLLAHNCKMVRDLRMIVATTDSGRMESE